MPTEMPDIPTDEFDVGDWIQTLEHRAQVDPKGSTPVNDAALARLLGAADCRAHVQALRREMRDEVDELKAAIEALQLEARGDIQNVRKLVEDLPEKFAAAAFADRAQERTQRNEIAIVRVELCRRTIDSLLGSKIFITFAGASLLTIAVGVFLSATSFDVSIADWFSMRADRSTETAAPPIPNGPPPEPTP